MTMLKLGSNSSISLARVVSADPSPTTWIVPVWASRLAAAGCSTTPTRAAFGPETVSCASGAALFRALSTPRS
jgi:hypothetical protein